MIDFQDVSKAYGAQTVLDRVSFRINSGERVGIVGPNGAGKSTIFGLITDEVSPDGGKVLAPGDITIGYVRQMAAAASDDATLLEFTESAVPALKTILRDIHDIEQKFQAGGDALPPAALKRLGDLQTEFEHRGGYDIRHRAEQTLCGLGFPVDWLGQAFNALSGGWKTRAELARALVAQPQLLLLDEPSNYLDLPAIEWLQSYLRSFDGTLLLISHDRYLLNTLTRATLEVANGATEKYPGNYDTYVKDRALRYEQRLSAQKNQDRKREQAERFIERFRSKATKASQVQSRIKMLEKMDTVDVPKVITSPGRIHFRPPVRSGQEVVRLEDAGLTYDGERWVLRKVDLRVCRGEKIAFVGYNGLGKTTLLRLLAGMLPLSEGKRVPGHKVHIGYQSQDFAETMLPSMSLLDTLRSSAPDLTDQERRRILGGFGFSGEAAEKQVGVLSGGEKIRVAFARLLASPPNFLVLDEPTTHLDIQARETLEQALQDYEGTICLVSHDVDFVRHVATDVIAMTPPGVTRYPGGYDYYREKMESAGIAPDEAAQPAQRKSPSAAKTGDRKTLRRERAEARQKEHAATKELKRAIRLAEARIESFETERAKLLEQLGDGEAGHDFEELNRRLKQIQEEIDLYTQRWEQAVAELEDS